jgi:hypothetical protein
VHFDHNYRDRGKTNQARSRVLTCEINFKQNVGYLGRKIVVTAVHGHYNTMKVRWSEVWVDFWDRLARRIKHFGVNFLAGDFNMSLTEVCKQLRMRNIDVSCAAWYPWLHTETEVHGSKLGFDSCGIFYIGGAAEVTPLYGLDHLSKLTAVAGEELHEELFLEMDEYKGANVPGQHWSCYRQGHKNQTDEQKDLMARLTDLLTPATLPDDLPAAVYYGKKSKTFPYLRLKQKKLDQKEWLVSHVNPSSERVTEIHAGAHFPLCIWTNNTGRRSKEAETRRENKKHPPQMTSTFQPLDTDFNKPWRDEWKASTAVAEGKEGFWVKGFWVGQDGVGAWQSWEGDSEWKPGGSSSSTGQTNGDPHAGWERWMDYR